MATTPNYGLFVTDDETTTFRDWRDNIASESESSNMMKIDAALQTAATDIAALQSNAANKTQMQTVDVTSASVDLNDYYQNGTYRFTGGSSQSISNKPADLASTLGTPYSLVLQVIRGGSNSSTDAGRTVYQILYGYRQVGTDTTASAWIRMFTYSGSIPGHDSTIFDESPVWKQFALDDDLEARRPEYIEQHISLDTFTTSGKFYLQDVSDSPDGSASGMLVVYNGFEGHFTGVMALPQRSPIAQVYYSNNGGVYERIKTWADGDEIGDQTEWKSWVSLVGGSGSTIDLSSYAKIGSDGKLLQSQRPSASGIAYNSSYSIYEIVEQYKSALEMADSNVQLIAQSATTTIDTEIMPKLSEIDELSQANATAIEGKADIADVARQSITYTSTVISDAAGHVWGHINQFGEKTLNIFDLPLLVDSTTGTNSVAFTLPLAFKPKYNAGSAFYARYGTNSYTLAGWVSASGNTFNIRGNAPAGAYITGQIHYI